jgi:ABC-type nitrate/sulfonate/bicarbonate transport system permease component
MSVNAPTGGVPRTLPLPDDKNFAALWQLIKVPTIMIASLVIFLAFWEWMQTAIQLIPALFLPPPSEIMAALIPNLQNGVLPEALAWSLRNMAVGFGLATIVSIPLGLVMGTSRIISRILGPYVWIFYSTPRVAFLPIIIVAMGFDWESKVFLIFITCFFPILINTVTGVEGVDQSLLKAGRVFGASKFELFRKVVLPYAMPFVMSGLRISASRGLVTLYVSEVYGTTNGIGKVMIQAGVRYETDLVFAGLVCLLVLSLAFVSVLGWIEKAITPWRQEVHF